MCVCYSGGRRLLHFSTAWHHRGSHLPLSVCTGASLSISLSLSSHLPVDSAADCLSKRVERQLSPSIDTLAEFLGDRYHCLVCLSVSLVYCGQTAGWIKMPLGTELGLSLGDIVLDGDPAPTHGKGHSSPPLFGPCLLWPNGWMDQDSTWYGGRPQPRRHCVRWGVRPSSPPRKGAQQPPAIFSPLCSRTVTCLSNC